MRRLVNAVVAEASMRPLRQAILPAMAGANILSICSLRMLLQQHLYLPRGGCTLPTISNFGLISRLRWNKWPFN